MQVDDHIGISLPSVGLLGESCRTSVIPYLSASRRYEAGGPRPRGGSPDLGNDNISEPQLADMKRGGGAPRSNLQNLGRGTTCWHVVIGISYRFKA